VDRYKSAEGAFYTSPGRSPGKVGPTDLDALVRYVDSQETHHGKVSFQDELRVFLRKYGIEFDERYLWD